MPGKGHKLNVYLNLSNGYESLRLYIYTISTSDDLVWLIEMCGKLIKFGKIPNYPRQLVYYKIGITNEICVLELDNGLGKGDELLMILVCNRWQWACKGLGACKRLSIVQGRLY